VAANNIFVQMFRLCTYWLTIKSVPLKLSNLLTQSLTISTDDGILLLGKTLQ